MYKVLKDFRGSPDGCRVLDYEKGQALEISSNFSQDLADVAVAEGWATKYLIDPDGEATEPDATEEVEPAEPAKKSKARKKAKK